MQRGFAAGATSDSCKGASRRACGVRGPGGFVGCHLAAPSRALTRGACAAFARPRSGPREASSRPRLPRHCGPCVPSEARGSPPVIAPAPHTPAAKPPAASVLRVRSHMRAPCGVCAIHSAHRISGSSRADSVREGAGPFLRCADATAGMLAAQVRGTAAAWAARPAWQGVAAPSHERPVAAPSHEQPAAEPFRDQRPERRLRFSMSITYI